MRVRPQTHFPHAPQQLLPTFPFHHPPPQRQRIDEEPDQPFRLPTRPVRDRRPHHHFFLAAVTLKQHLEGRQQRHEHRHPGPLTELRQPFRQTLTQLHRQLSPAVTLYRWPPSIRRQLQLPRRPHQLRAPV